MTLIKKTRSTVEPDIKPYKIMLELSSEAMVLTDAVGNILALSTPAKNLLQSLHTSEEKELASYFPEPEKFRKASREILARGKGSSELIFDDKSFLLKGESLQNEHSNTWGLLLLLQTKQASISGGKSYSSDLIEHAGDSIFVISNDGTIKLWNKSAEKLFGYSQEEIIGKKYDLLIPEGLNQEEEKIFSNVREGQTVLAYETFRTTRQGELVNVNVRLSLQGNTAESDISVIARESAESGKFEKELIEARKNAEHEKKVAQEAMESKQRFLSNMSHEIRTPLNAIIGFTKVVLKSELSPRQKEYLEAIKVSGDALIVLINDILDLAKVDAGKMTFEKIPFKLKESLDSMLHLFETKLHKKELSLEKDYDPSLPERIVGDPVRLHQVILNLVSNAIKFTHKGKITVRVSKLSEDHDNIQLLFRVSDTGIGIEPNKLDSIFDYFDQASSETSRIYGGTGLGLAIVKQLVTAQGGQVSVLSEPGQGSTFQFSLTFGKAKGSFSENKSAGDEYEEVKTDAVKVLVVEDVTLNQLLVKTLLDQFGFNCTIAGNGQVAVDILKERKFDVVLMDLQMPVMNGYEATKIIRNDLHLEVPIIALTADVTTADVSKVRSAGMNDYMAKPIDDKLLYAKILKYSEREGDEEKTEMEAEERTRIYQHIDLTYLKEHTKNDGQLMKQLIRTYLLETPGLIGTMKQSIDNMDWKALAEASHALIPTFSIVGIDKEFEEIAKKIKEHALKQEESSLINNLLQKIENKFHEASKELEAELEIL